MSKRIPPIDIIKECKVAIHSTTEDSSNILPSKIKKNTLKSFVWEMEDKNKIIKKKFISTGDNERIILKSLVEERGDYINALPVSVRNIKNNIKWNIFKSSFIIIYIFLYCTKKKEKLFSSFPSEL